ncbi:hypothetical protein ACJJTC_010690 [Scirpophaga incertulas]
MPFRLNAQTLRSGTESRHIMTRSHEIRIAFPSPNSAVVESEKSSETENLLSWSCAPTPKIRPPATNNDGQSCRKEKGRRQEKVMVAKLRQWTGIAKAAHLFRLARRREDWTKLIADLH